LTTIARIIADFSSIDERDWGQLDHRANPFLSRAFLNALEQSGSVTAEAGWQPHHLALYRDDRLVAFAPTYIKGHSHGEFVFDWAWADAYHRNGYNYYPKLLTAIPWSPVTGPRLLTARDEPDRKSLRRELVAFGLEECVRLGLSGWHCNFTEKSEENALQQADILARTDTQFHWFNQGYATFEDFLAQLRSRKRKQVHRERRQVQQAGVRFEWKSGDDLSRGELDFVYRCYTNTFRAHGNHAALLPGFFDLLSQSLAGGMQVALASRAGELIAMSLFLQGGGRLYGRYWGCVEEIPGLHFEAAYYQGIEHCIENGIEVFESGAQGEHKLSRGFVPTATRSWHWIRHEGFRQAIARHLEQESDWVEDYRDSLQSHVPFRRENQ
jgi:predicted N-acyltransferase